MEAVKYSVVIPVYNAENSIEELAARISGVFASRGETFELIFVDDFSRDNSWLKLARLAAENRRIKCIKLAQNCGQHHATLCGIAYTRGDYVITMDDDLQHAPEDIPKLIEKMNKTRSKAVIAKLTNKKFAWYRRKASDLVRKIAEITINKPKGIHLSSFRLIEGQTAREMLRFSTAVSYFPALLFRVTTDVVNVEIEHNARRYGDSNYTIPKMFKLAFRLLISDSNVSRRLAGDGKSSYVVEKTIL